MALKKSLVINGINCEYHRVKQVIMPVSGAVTITFASYVKEEVRNAEKNAGVSIYQGTIDISIPEGFSLSSLNKEGNNPVAEAYSIIKQKSQEEEENTCSRFKDAIDV